MQVRLAGHDVIVSVTHVSSEEARKERFGKEGGQNGQRREVSRDSQHYLQNL